MDDCKTEVKESSEQSDELEKAFTIGMAIGFGKKYDEMDKIMEAIKALTPKPKTDVLDKIRSEIEGLNALRFSSGERIYKDEVLEIIDKYKAGSEGEE